MLMKIKELMISFYKPLLVLLGIIIYLILKPTGTLFAVNTILIISTLLGSIDLIKETIEGVKTKQYALDYIAILAIFVSLLTGEYLVAAILALMIASGRNLESYAVTQAKKSLTRLIERIPDEVTIWRLGKILGKEKIKNITIGQYIFIRKGEVIPLDGLLESENGLTDESSLTGEPYFIEKIKGDILRSGTVNIGDSIAIQVTKMQGDSTYNKIVEMVKKAQNEKSPMVRLADKYSHIFTVTTFLIAGFAYVHSGFELSRVLSVLAIATPCPLIIATPIALLGGVNAAAKKRIIVKRLAGLEVLSRVTTVVFDKTGTITLGKPTISKLEISDKKYSQKEILAVAESIERNSLHPLAKAITEYAKKQNAPIYHAEKVTEKIGSGIFANVGGKSYSLTKLKEDVGMSIELRHSDESRHSQKRIAIFHFEDEIKSDSKSTIQKFKSLGLKLFIFTGDKKENAEIIAKHLGTNVTVKASLSPTDKQEEIQKLQDQGDTVAMIGDGINDAPALALANVGMVFSNEEQTASSEAADIVFLGGNFGQAAETMQISRRTVNIARQSIICGIGLSISGMVFASVGFIPPIYGAGLQEIIDVAVILNAIRASL